VASCVGGRSPAVMTTATLTRHLACSLFSRAVAKWKVSDADDGPLQRAIFPWASHGPSPQMTSHETVCLLNASDRDALVRITVFYSDREPAGPYQLVVPGTTNEACPLQRSQ